MRFAGFNSTELAGSLQRADDPARHEELAVRVAGRIEKRTSFVNFINKDCLGTYSPGQKSRRRIGRD
jgi:hypothetical protein